MSAAGPPRGSLPTPVEGKAAHALAWAVSLGVHGTILALAVSLTGDLLMPSREDPERLVFVEPAPPPPPAPRAAPVAAIVPPSAPEPEEALALPATPEPTRTRPPTPVPTRTAPSVAKPVAATPSPTRGASAVTGGPPTPRDGADSLRSTAGAGSESATAGGAAGGVPGGVPGGLVGGVVGGRGDEVQGAAGVAQMPVAISRVAPVYPREARAQRREARVVLQAVIDREGRVEEPIIVLESAPPFDQAALAALRQWKFTPGRDHEGRKVRVRIEVPMRFEIQSAR